MSITIGDAYSIAQRVYAKFVSEGYDPEKMIEIRKRIGLDIDHIVTNTTTGGYITDNIQVDASTDGNGNITQTRQP